MPFEEAPFGVTGLETAFAACHTHLVRTGELDLALLVSRMSQDPAAALGLPVPTLDDGADGRPGPDRPRRRGARGRRGVPEQVAQLGIPRRRPLRSGDADDRGRADRMEDVETRHAALLRREDTGLILVDVQEAFRPVIDGFDRRGGQLRPPRRGLRRAGPPGAGERAVPQGPRTDRPRAGRAAARRRRDDREAALLGLRGRRLRRGDRGRRLPGLGDRGHRDPRLRQPDRARPAGARPTTSTSPPTRSPRERPRTGPSAWRRWPPTGPASPAPRWPSSRCSRWPARRSSRQISKLVR